MLRTILTRFVTGIVLLSLLLFIPSGSFKYYNAWFLLALIIIPITYVTVYFYNRDPEFLRRRLKMHEKEKEQRLIIKLASLLYILGFIIPGLDYRYGWSDVPLWLVLFSGGVFLFSYLLVFKVFKTNSFASRVVEVESGQKVIDSGPYSVLRHPMYTGTVLMMLFMPLLLGSYYGLIPNVLLPPVFIFRLLNEEKVLTRDLPGYKEYCDRVKYRLIPYIW
ncbi:MAG: isoprenylcysteine carboxylmethyltransferase family protein [Ignavibacteriaceae bacterium]|nr:isoprenylcysteine carboxylmethyltransferase family protein [Ignavibacteriaceae bacterium]